MDRKSKRQHRDTHHTPTPTPAQSTPSAIKNCPTEIWARIFSLACVDDGFTGRSLSLVSRYIMEASKFYKYQCLAVKDHQLRPLALAFKNLPADSRRVRCLFLSQASWELGYRYWGRDRGEFFLADKNRLLQMVALTLEKLEVGCYSYRFRLPFQLPVLVDLTIHGACEHNVTTKIPVCYPALRHLRLDLFPTSAFYQSSLIPIICAGAPTLSVIRSSLSFDSDSATMATLSALKTKLKIKKIIIEPHDAFLPNYQTWKAGYLQDIRNNGRSDDGLVLLKPRLRQAQHFRATDARERWSEACAGRTNYWEPNEEDLDPQVH
jgi:hypothetical protein